MEDTAGFPTMTIFVMDIAKIALFKLNADFAVALANGKNRNQNPPRRLSDRVITLVFILGLVWLLYLTAAYFANKEIRDAIKDQKKAG